MKILFVDFIYFVKTHKNMNVELIKALNKVGEVTVLSPSGYYDTMPENIQWIQYQPLKEQVKYRDRLSNSMKIMKMASRLDKKKHFDVIWVPTFDNLAFAIGHFFFQNKEKMFLMHQYNTDMIQISKRDRKAFSSYKHKVHHVLAEEFFCDFIREELGVEEELLHYVPHPAYDLKEDVEKIYDCVGISNSNVEELIQSIIEYEQRTQVFKIKKKKVILRSKQYEYDDGYLKVFQGFLPKEEYMDYMKHAKIIYMPFPQSFCYRISGTLIEALSAETIVVGTGIPLIKDYQKRYTGCCYVAECVEELVDTICEDKEKNIENFQRFKREHSEAEVARYMKKAFQNGRTEDV